jgi:hypothetical protein
MLAKNRIAFSFVLSIAIAMSLSIACAQMPAFAEEGESSSAESAESEADAESASSTPDEELPHSDQRYYLGSAVNAGHDTGFSKSDEITEKDPHFGWELGRFYVSGYTRQTTSDDGTLVFLKNVGDKVGLYFNLEQDIDCLNGNGNLTICDDANGSDQQYGIGESDFGRGTLIVRHIDYQNNANDVVYNDYLSALTAGADTEIDLFEEGDYEVALDYEVKDAPLVIPGIQVEAFPSYSNYRIAFKFSVRNGNCMVFPFDVATRSELTNKTSTPNGFRLDLARSRYLDIDIKRETLSSNGNELVEDTRFNGPAADGDEYTEEGLYVITVRNRYTGQQTTKQIYVGTDDVMRAYAATGEPISDIREQIANGATVDSDGNIVLASKSVVGQPASSSANDANLADEPQQANDSHDSLTKVIVAVIVIAVAAAVIVAFVLIRKRRAKGADGQTSNDQPTPSAPSQETEGSGSDHSAPEADADDAAADGDARENDAGAPDAREGEER